MLRIAILGCGKIADAHVSQILRIQGCEIVAVCDREPLMARQLQERFPVGTGFTDLERLLAEVKPDVVHITTPPESHFDLARTCVLAGCHVYVEKPFTLNAEQARTLVTLAEENGVKLTAGHDDQFSHVARRLRSLVNGGYLGGPPVHMESTFCYELGQTYARALFGDQQHWVRKLPGKLLHNIISHGIARIAEFLTCDSPTVIAHGFTSPLLSSVGETEILDELRVIISEPAGTTAYFTFSSQMRPLLHQFAVYGPRNGLLLDQDHETLLKLHGATYKSYLEKFVPPVVFARQHIGNLAFNAGRFLRRDFHAKAGMHGLIDLFYQSIRDHTPPPIPYREIILTATIMDRIFDQLQASPRRVAAAAACDSIC